MQCTVSQYNEENNLYLVSTDIRICAVYVAQHTQKMKEGANRPWLDLLHASQMYLCEALFGHKIYN